MLGYLLVAILVFCALRALLNKSASKFNEEYQLLMQNNEVVFRVMIMQSMLWIVYVPYLLVVSIKDIFKK